MTYLRTNLVDAVRSKDLTSLRQLLEAGVNPNYNEDNVEGFTPLHWAIYLGDVQAANLLVSFGADVNLPDKEGMTPLGYCAALGNTAAAQVLLDKGARIDQESHGATPLYWAVQEAHLDMIRYLSNHGADMDTSGGNTTTTPLANAAGEGSIEIVRLLLDLGSNVNHTNQYGTALHTACAYGQISIVKELLEKGASVNVANKDGLTSLFFAIKSKSPEIVEVLIHSGAQYNIKDVKGLTPIDYARKISNVAAKEHIERILSQYSSQDEDLSQ